MRRARRAVAPGIAVLLACMAPGRAAEAIPPQPQTMPAAGPAAVPACGTQAARYASDSGFGLIVVRAGQVRVENPLRPLTPEITQVLEVVIGSKVATAYGPDYATLRRGGSPGAIGALLGAPVRWEAALPTLPDPMGIVGDDGAALAQLSFRGCEAAPAAAKAPVRADRKAAKPRKPTPAASKTPPGFSLPQGAIAE